VAASTLSCCTALADVRFSLNDQAWAEARIPDAFHWRIAHRRDLAAYRSSHDETLRALKSSAH
jgi:hypothetical protein